MTQRARLTAEERQALLVAAGVAVDVLSRIWRGAQGRRLVPVSLRALAAARELVAVLEGAGEPNAGSEVGP